MKWLSSSDRLICAPVQNDPDGPLPEKSPGRDRPGVRNGVQSKEWQKIGNEGDKAGTRGLMKRARFIKQVVCRLHDGYE